MSLIDHIQIVGHVCHDTTDSGYILGGTASYCSLAAAHLCHKVHLYTSYGPDFLFKDLLVDHGVEIHTELAMQTTIFENIYQDNERIQYLHERAGELPLTSDNLNTDADIILLSPITNEVHFDSFLFDNTTSLIGGTIQGWLRTFGEDGRVLAYKPDLRLFDGLDVIIMSDDDIAGMPTILAELQEVVPLIVVTRGAEGADVHSDGQKLSMPSFKTDIIDLTGAGDVFSVAFLCAYRQNTDVIAATSFAHAAASLSIEGMGIHAIPSLDKILERQNKYVNKYL